LCAGNTIEAQDAKFDSAEVARRNTGEECQIGQGQSAITPEGSECGSHTGRQCSAWVRISAPSIHQNIAGVHDNMLTYYESTAKRVFHRSSAAFTEEDAIVSRFNASCFAAHMFEVLCAPGVSAVRFCSEVILCSPA